jgi:LAO/AO transport system kinase
VGVGQSEVEVAALADTTIVVLAPGMGDAIQAAKAGILEVADVFVVNKADRDGADLTVRELRAMVSHGRREDAAPGSWRQPIVTTVATTGQGLPELLDAVGAHQAWLDGDGRREQRRHRRHAAEIEALAWQTWHRQWFDGARPTGLLAGLARDVEEGRTDPYAAAAELIRTWRDTP